MRRSILMALPALCGLAAAGVLIWTDGWTTAPPAHKQATRSSGTGLKASRHDTDRARPDGLFIDQKLLEDGGLSLASQFTGPIHNPHSLRELREAIQRRGRRGLAVLQAELDQIGPGPYASAEQVLQVMQLQKSIGLP